jgi:hypothetical protein
LSNGGSILEQKRLRKRMALMEMERNRGLNASLSLTSSSERGLRSFEQSQQDKAVLMEAKRAVASGGHSVASFNPNSCFESDVEGSKPSDNVVSDHVSELRRRRLYEMHHHRPYSQTKPKKKFKFWQQEKPTPFHQQPQQMYLLKQQPGHQAPVNNFNGLIKQSASFSDYGKYRDPGTPRDDSIEYSLCTNHEFDVNWIHPMNKLRAAHTTDEGEYDDDEPSFISSKASPRVLWNETSNLQTQMEALALGQQQDGNLVGFTPRPDEDRDEIMDGLVYDDDEIMTPVMYRKYIASPTIICTAETTVAADRSSLISPDASAMITPLLEAVTFETPEKVSAPVVATSMKAFHNSLLESDIEDVIAEITPTNSGDEVVLSPPNAPKKERIHKTPSTDEDEVTMKAASSTLTPATVGTAATTNTTPASEVVPMDQSGDETMMPMTAVKLSVNPDSGVIQWQSLYRDEKGEVLVTKSPEENPTKVASLQEVATVIEALSEQKVQGADGIVNPSANNNMLKLFTHLYQQSTYDEIIRSIPEIEEQPTLVIARGLDFSASTYHTASEVKALLEALKHVNKLDSIMLLNFRPESMVDLAKTLNQHPSIYRLLLHLTEGTINGELLGVMATAPRLTHVQIDLKESCAIGTLLNSKSLQSLRITSGNISLDKAHLRTLIYGLGSNTALTTLDLAPEMSLEHFRSMCSALRENNRLESLRVCLKLTTEADSQTATLELANLLKKNRSIVSVWNYAHEESSPPSVIGKRILQEALKKNDGHVKEIKFYSEDLNESWLVSENPESFILGIQPRQQDIIFNHYEEPSTICSNSYTSFTDESNCGNDCDVVPSAEFCGVLHTVANSLQDCVWPDFHSVIGDWKQRETNNRKKNESTTSVSVL